jgi:hypothetical protein
MASWCSCHSSRTLWTSDTCSHRHRQPCRLIQEWPRSPASAARTGHWKAVRRAELIVARLSPAPPAGQASRPVPVCHRLSESLRSRFPSGPWGIFYQLEATPQRRNVGRRSAELPTIRSPCCSPRRGFPSANEPRWREVCSKSLRLGRGGDRCEYFRMPQAAGGCGSG